MSTETLREAEQQAEVATEALRDVRQRNEGLQQDNEGLQQDNEGLQQELHEERRLQQQRNEGLQQELHQEQVARSTP